MDERLLKFICEYKRAHDGNSPTMREMMAACRISSTSMVDYYLRRLENGGHIRRGGKGKSAAIEVMGGRWLFIPNRTTSRP
jgi:SOS-response transcriptional repressor LexA